MVEDDNRVNYRIISGTLGTKMKVSNKILYYHYARKFYLTAS